MATEITEANILLLIYDAGLKNYTQSLLEGEGYRVYLCDNEDGVLKELADKKIDLLILDFSGVNTFEICKKIRANFSLRHIPIILLVEKEHTIEKIKGIYAGADDYAEKPLRAGEILPRIKANLWRAKRDLNANPLTKLPGNVSILKEIEKKIKDKAPFCVAYADLDKFKEHNDYHGFDWGDRVIKHTASLISGVLIELGTPHDFLGHIGGDDFIFITDWANIRKICEKIIEDFNKTITSFYKEEDLKRGYIITQNRRRKTVNVPILTISIGVATNEFRSLEHIGKVIQIITELKNCAKASPGSSYIIDRRKS